MMYDWMIQVLMTDDPIALSDTQEYMSTITSLHDVMTDIQVYLT